MDERERAEPDHVPGLEDRGSWIAGTVWMMLVSVCLVWLPILNWVIAGLLGGRKARTRGAALNGALFPAVFWTFTVVLWAQHGVATGKGQLFYLPPAFAWVPAPILLGAALSAASARASTAARIGGLVLALAGVGIGVSILAPYWRAAQLARPPAGTAEQRESNDCPARLKRLYNALLTYSDAYDGMLPPAGRWMGALTDPAQTLARPDDLHDPALGSDPSRFGYAMNSAVGGKRLKEIKDPARTPLFYDSSNLAENASDPVTSLPAPGRHQGRNNVIYLDGRVEQR